MLKTKIPLSKPYLIQMPQSKPYNQHNKKQRKQKCKGNINERHFNLKKKKKTTHTHTHTQNTQKENRKLNVIYTKEKHTKDRAPKERALPHQLTMQLK